MNPKQEHAMVLSGGGASGAYQVGVMKALIEGQAQHLDQQPITPQIYSGTSVGSFNAAFMAAQQDNEAASSVLDELDYIWRYKIAAASGNCGNGVFRLRGDPSPYMGLECLAKNPMRPFADLFRDGVALGNDAWERLLDSARKNGPLLKRLLEIPDLSAFISATPLKQLVQQHVDLSRLESSSREVRVTASDWQRGQPVTFGKKDILQIGHQAILASAAIPAIFPPVAIGEDIFVDGGVTMNTPIKPAIEAWREQAETDSELSLHVIFLSQDIADVPVATAPSTFSVTNRLMDIFMNRNISADIARAARINERLKEDEDAVATPDGKPKSRKKGIAIHRYRPRTNLGGALGLLDFSSERIDQLIQEGYEDTRIHDCEEQGCVLVEDS